MRKLKKQWWYRGMFFLLYRKGLKSHVGVFVSGHCLVCCTWRAEANWESEEISAHWCCLMKAIPAVIFQRESGAFCHPMSWAHAHTNMGGNVSTQIVSFNGWASSMQANISDVDVYVQGRNSLFAEEYCSKHCYSPTAAHSSLQNQCKSFKVHLMENSCCFSPCSGLSTQPKVAQA